MVITYSIVVFLFKYLDWHLDLYDGKFKGIVLFNRMVNFQNSSVFANFEKLGHPMLCLQLGVLAAINELYMWESYSPL